MHLLCVYCHNKNFPKIKWFIHAITWESIVIRKPSLFHNNHVLPLLDRSKDANVVEPTWHKRDLFQFNQRNDVKPRISSLHQIIVVDPFQISNDYHWSIQTLLMIGGNLN